jgi:dipeptide/tripeptide permease
VTSVVVLAAVSAWPPLQRISSALGAPVWLAIGALLLVAAVGVPRFTARARSPLTRVERERVLAILVMGLFVVFFWMGLSRRGAP